MPTNSLRVGKVVSAANFDYIEIDWSGSSPQIELQVRDISGSPRIRQVFELSALRV
ncbi:MAG: hypothetical protein ABW034_14405 [Steroidobacteraceae bacterium]